MILALSAAASVTMAADRSDTPGDYSHVIPITVSGTQAIVQLQLPRAVYLEARSHDLRDLRVFDSAGMSMPFSLIEREPQKQVSKSIAPVAIFAVHAPVGATHGLPDGLQIRTRDDGAVISVTVPSVRGAEDELASLVLDIQAPGRTANATEPVAVSALSFDLPRAVENYNARLFLETSDDLKSWEPLTEASVSWLANSHGATARNNRVEFAPRQFRYARVAWLEGKPLEFATITAEFVASVRSPQQWESVVLSAVPGKVGDDLIFAAPVAIPVQAVGVVFHSQNVVLPVLLGQYQIQQGKEARSMHSVDLRPITRATFYQLIQNGQRRGSGEIEVPLTHAEQWVLRPQAKLADRPELRLLWKPATMVFVAGGKGPYILAFGRDGGQSVNQPLAQVAPGFSPAELAALEQAKTGPATQQHERNTSASDRPAGIMHRREVWLWVLLIGGVAILAVMAWRLIGQMKDESSDQPPA